MQLKGIIVHLAITEEKKILSLRLRIGDVSDGEAIEEIKKLKGVQQRYTFICPDNENDTFYLTGEINSINIRQEMTIILHTPVSVPLVIKAVEFMGKPLYVRFTTAIEKELRNLLNTAARKESTEPEEILYKLTTFIKDGVTRPGKRSIYNVSDPQRRVLVSRLHKMLSAQP